MHNAMREDATQDLRPTPLIVLLLDALDKQRHRIVEYAILLVEPGTGLEGR